MKKVLTLSLVAGVSFAAGRMFEEFPRTAAAGSDQGTGGAEECSTKNGDVNADGKVELSDAVMVLGHLFLGNPTKLVGLCDTPELEACRAELAMTQAALVSSEEKLALCQAVKSSTLLRTGQTKCYDASGKVISCDGATCPGQDSKYATGCPSEGRFVDNEDGTVTDNCTGFMWQKDTADVDRDGRSTIDDHAGWCDSLTYCENLSFAGHDDWRLPNIRELQSIVDYGLSEQAIDPVFSAESDFYWSSTPQDLFPFCAWGVIFNVGYTFAIHSENELRLVRAVRGGP